MDSRRYYLIMRNVYSIGGYILLVIEAIAFSNTEPGKMSKSQILWTLVGMGSLVAVGLLYVVRPIKSKRANIELLVSITALSILTFAWVYVSLGTSQHFGQRLTHTDALYFALTTFTTTGYGDITARSQFARNVVSYQMALDLFVLLAVVGVLISRLTAQQGGDSK